MFSKRIGIIPLLFVVMLSIQGCGKKDEPKPVVSAPAAAAPQAAPTPLPQPQPPAAAPAPQSTAPAAPATPAPPASAAPDTQAAAPAPVAPPAPQSAPAKALASADGVKPGSRIDVQELKRTSGGTLMLKFTLINEDDQTFPVGYALGAGSTTDSGTVGGVHLIEPVGKKKYLVVRDSENKCDCSRGVKDVERKSRVNLWARFPAPPDNVEKINVVIPQFSPMDDVAISR